MKIRERQLVYAFALVENAKNTLYTATQVIGNTLRYGKDGDIRDEILGAAKTLENARRKMEEVMDANTDWSSRQNVAKAKPAQSARAIIQMEVEN